MKRLFLMFALTLILLGSLSESVGSLNRPWIEGETGINPGVDADHPWGGDNVTTGTGTTTPGARTMRAQTTGIGAIDMVLRGYYYKFMPRLSNGRSMRVTESNQPPVTTEVGNSTSTTTGNKPTDNQ